MPCFIYMIFDSHILQELHSHPKALKGVRGSVGAPMPGEVVSVKVIEGDDIVKGQAILVLIPNSRWRWLSPLQCLAR